MARIMTIDLALDGCQLPGQRRVVVNGLGDQAVDLLGVGLREFGHQLRRQQVLLDRLEDAALDLLAGDGAVVPAQSLGAVSGAAVAVLSHDGVATTTTAAGEQAGEQEAAAMSPVERLALICLSDLKAKTPPGAV